MGKPDWLQLDFMWVPNGSNRNQKMWVFQLAEEIKPGEKQNLKHGKIDHQIWTTLVGNMYSQHSIKTTQGVYQFEVDMS